MKFLNYKNNYNNYEKEDLYLSGYPNYKTKYKNERHISSRVIKKIYEEFQFEHTLDTRGGSSGSPICLSSNLNVIGIHKSGDKEENINYGTFIGKILDELIDDIKNEKNKKENNVENNPKISQKIDFKDKIKKCVCKFSFQYYKTENYNSTGFFCLFPFMKKSNLIPTLITAFDDNKRFKSLTYYPKIKIKITFNNNEFRELEIDRFNRIIYYSNKANIILIELKQGDGINNFLELDESILNGNNKKEYEYLNELIFIFSCYTENREEKPKNFYFSFGKIIKNGNWNNIFYTCKTGFGSMGAPVISSETNKVIGVYMGYDEAIGKMRFGYLIENFINEFNEFMGG